MCSDLGSLGNKQILEDTIAFIIGITVLTSGAFCAGRVCYKAKQAELKEAKFSQYLRHPTRTEAQERERIEREWVNRERVNREWINSNNQNRDDNDSPRIRFLPSGNCYSNDGLNAYSQSGGFGF